MVLEVRSLTALRLGLALEGLGPPPTRFVSGATNHNAVHLDKLDLALPEFSRLVRLIEVCYYQGSQAISLTQIAAFDDLTILKLSMGWTRRGGRVDDGGGISYP